MHQLFIILMIAFGLLALATVPYDHHDWWD